MENEICTLFQFFLHVNEWLCTCRETNTSKTQSSFGLEQELILSINAQSSSSESLPNLGAPSTYTSIWMCGDPRC